MEAYHDLEAGKEIVISSEILSTNSDELFEDIHEYFYLFGASAEN
jgi:hypothetical protein